MAGGPTPPRGPLVQPSRSFAASRYGGEAACLCGPAVLPPVPGAELWPPGTEEEVMSRQGDVYENRVTGEYGIILRGTEDRGDGPMVGLLIARPGGAVAGEHVHPHYQERFKVLSGRLGARIGGKETLLVAGDEATVPPGVAHDWWNGGDEDARVLIEVSPGSWGDRFELMIGTLFGLGNAGRTNGKGMPNLLQLAAMTREFSDVVRFTRPPLAVQRLLFGVLGPLARRAGYRGSYPEYSRPHDHVVVDPEVLRVAGLRLEEPV